MFTKNQKSPMNCEEKLPAKTCFLSMIFYQIFKMSFIFQALNDNVSFYNLIFFLME